MGGTLDQSIGMTMSGQAAATQPTDPQSRREPNSFRASSTFANAMALATDSVGT